MSKKNRVYKRNIFGFIVGLFRVILIVALFPFVLIWFFSNLKKRRARRRELKERIEIFDMTQIDALSGVEFEQLLNRLFELQGYKSVVTKKSHDYGADLVLEKKNKISIVQAKCYGKNVGIKAVQEIVAAKPHYKASDAFVATNRHFSKDAVVLALEHNVKLIDRDVLFSLVKKFKPTIEVSAKRFAATLDSSVQEIESKYKYWI